MMGLPSLLTHHPPHPEHPEAMCQWGTAPVSGLSSGGTWFLSALAARSPVFCLFRETCC